MHLRSIYYLLKPLMPRRLQLALRRCYAVYLRRKHRDVWPIDERAAKAPEGWPGWPDGKRFALVLTHDADTARGQDRCLQLMKLEKSLGFRSSFNMVPRRYGVVPRLRNILVENGFEVGVHGLYHDGKYFESREEFSERAGLINHYLREWCAVGYRSPSMLHNLDWIRELNIEYDSSTFDTDPFEPQPDGVCTIYPFTVSGTDREKGYIELPYTLPQDFLLFVVLRQRDIRIWKEKLDWIARNGGMALLNTHPDYMLFDGGTQGGETYPAEHYREFLEYVKSTYEGQYWHALPKDVARYMQDQKIAEPSSETPVKGKPVMKTEKHKKIWIDLDNSPHVPLFKPIIDELGHRGYDCMVTSRDCFQVAGLVDLYGLKCETIGKHYGKNTLMKLFGLVYRGLQLTPSAIKEKPTLALSHGSRSQQLVSRMLGIPNIIMNDYEYVTFLPFNDTSWLITPEYIHGWSDRIDPSHISTYSGLKEDVYVPEFVPDPSIMGALGLSADHLIITVRPPANEAHYHNPEADRLFEEVMEHFGAVEKTTLVILPRNEHQAEAIRAKWPNLIESRKAVIPDHVVDGLNLMWHSDLVISGGGTMNREAAALGVPVYSIFRGTIGAVDHYLAEQGRLILLESPADVQTKIRAERRDKSRNDISHSKAVLNRIVDEIVRITETCNGHAGLH